MKRAQAPIRGHIDALPPDFVIPRTALYRSRNLLCSNGEKQVPRVARNDKRTKRGSLASARDDIAMMLIPCPWCGPRNQIEFTYGGDATPRRPAPGAPESAWVDYVYLRKNACGPHDELWYHGAGCRSWFRVRRDTRTHEVLGSATIDQSLPAGS